MSEDITDQLWTELWRQVDDHYKGKTTSASVPEVLRTLERLREVREADREYQRLLNRDDAERAARAATHTRQLLLIRGVIATLLGGLTALVAQLIFGRAPATTTRAPDSDSLGLLIGQIDRLVQLVAVRLPQPDTGASVWAAWLIGVALIVGLAVALWALITSRSDAFSKVLGAAILAIGGLFAVARFQSGALAADWGDVAVGGLLAIVAGLGLAALPRITPATTEWDRRFTVRAWIGGALAVLCTLGLVFVAYGRHVARKPVPPDGSKPRVIESQTPQGGSVPLPPSNPSRVIAMTPLSTVGTFPKGIASPTDRPCTTITEAESQALATSVNEAVARVTEARRDRHPDLLLLVASFDRSRLRGACESRFKTNTELATQRAQWIVDGLKARGVAIDTVQTIVSGPTTTAGDASSDRTVAVYRVVAKEP